MVKIETLVVGQLQTNCHLVFDSEEKKAVIIDPGDDADFIIRKIKDLALKPQLILATHGHFDHVLGVTELKLAFNIPFYLNAKDAKILKRTQPTAKYFTGLDFGPAPKVDHNLSKDKLLQVTSSKLQVIPTPGHTPGSVSFYCQEEKIIFVGDLMFERGGWGRTDLEGGDETQIKKSIKKVLNLSEKIIIYPGHGRSTTVKDEKICFWREKRTQGNRKK